MTKRQFAGAAMALLLAASIGACTKTSPAAPPVDTAPVSGPVNAAPAQPLADTHAADPVNTAPAQAAQAAPAQASFSCPRRQVINCMPPYVPQECNHASEIRAQCPNVSFVY